MDTRIHSLAWSSSHPPRSLFALRLRLRGPSAEWKRFYFGLTPRADEAADKVGKADPRGLKPARNGKNKRLRRWPKGQLYPKIAFFSTLLRLRLKQMPPCGLVVMRCDGARSHPFRQRRAKRMGHPQCGRSRRKDPLNPLSSLRVERGTDPAEVDREFRRACLGFELL